jgi:hypothetical protein
MVSFWSRSLNGKVAVTFPDNAPLAEASIFREF